ncbi:Alpha/Beta hydrolase protein [Flammula alnicola]|nr:Alpha/Beta hydrolase protein [Flammula alnicola]
MAMTPNMSVDHFVLDTGSAGVTFKATMNRYRPRAIERHPRDPGYILLLAHGTGFHKEQWEPTIEHLFEIDKENQNAAKILEAWAIDCQTHGEAAPLNDKVLSIMPQVLTIHDYADAFGRLYKSGLLGELEKGVQKVVLIGHSVGAIAVIFATSIFGPPSAVPFDMVILVDPPLFTPPMADQMTDMFRFVEQTTPHRRSIWESRNAAHEWLKSRIPWKFWDPRVLKLYTEHGLRDLPTPFHPDKNGVVLSCNPVDEAAAFAGTPDAFKAIEHLNKICTVIPFHLVFGARKDMFTEEVHGSIHDASVGRIIASVTRVEGAGHLVVQERPERLANTLYAILRTSIRSETPKL